MSNDVIEKFYKTIHEHLFPRGQKDVDIKANKLVWITSHKMDLDTARSVLLRSVVISILNDSFTKDRLVEHLQPYAIEYFTENELSDFYEYLLKLKLEFLKKKTTIKSIPIISEVESGFKKTVDIVKALLPFLIIVFILFVIFGNDLTIENNRETVQSVNIEHSYWSKQDVLETPYTGKFWKEYQEPIVAPLKIKTKTGADYLIKLVNTDYDKDYLRIFIRGGEQIDILVPLGEYEIKYAVGNFWYGISAKNKKYFGENTSFFKADEVFNFYETPNGYMGSTIELIPQREGNLRTNKIGAGAF